jgi:hypothetical protein
VFHRTYAPREGYQNGVRTLFDRVAYALETNAEVEQFEARYGVDPSEIAEHTARADAITTWSPQLKHDWLAAQGWRVGLWLQDCGPGDAHARKLCEAAARTGDDLLVVESRVGGNEGCYRIPADDPVALQLAFQQQPLSYRALPLSCSFVLCYWMDDVATYAGPPALPPLLSLFDSAEEERAHAMDYQRLVIGGDEHALVPWLLRLYDGFWWWQ